MKVFSSKPAVREKLDGILEELISLRRSIHAHPEQGYRETGTTKRVKDFLEGHGVAFCSFANMTGGYVYIDCGKKRSVGFRADLDALPVEERTGAEFASVIPGVMHACGHDMHTAIAAGLAVVLWRLKERLRANVLIVFQPAEECNPRGGAKEALKEGIFERFRVEEFYGLHMWPELGTGEIGVRKGALMASSDKLKITVTGKKAHAAEPQKGVDAISIAAEIISAVEHKIRREISPFETVLISIGSVQTTGRYNIVCDHAQIEGTIRCLNPETRAFVHRRVREVAEEIAIAYRGSAKAEIEDGYRAVINDAALTQRFTEGARAILGTDAVHAEMNPTLIGEDFSFYGEKAPAVYFFMGCESAYPLHSDCFLPAEEALERSVYLMAGYFLDFI